MAKKSKHTAIPESKHEAVVAAVRLAVQHQVAKWDAELAVEKILGGEYEMADFITYLAVGCDTPDDALTLAPIDIIPKLEKLALN